MAGGLFDLHVAMALRAGWRTLAADRSTFKDLFRVEAGAGAFVIQEDVLDEWHANLAPGLSPDHVSFREAWAPDQPELPQIVIQMMDEPHNVQPLGFYADTLADGREVLSDIVHETALISLFVSHPELLRALWVAVRAMMISSVEFFIQAGYDGLEYAGGGDLRPAWEPMPEGLGVLFRQQRWRTLSKPFAISPALTGLKPWFVAAEDATVDGAQGGVSPIVP